MFGVNRTQHVGLLFAFISASLNAETNIELRNDGVFADRNADGVLMCLINAFKGQIDGLLEVLMHLTSASIRKIAGQLFDFVNL